MLIQGVAGVQTVPAGQAANLRMGLDADLIVTELHPRYYENTVRRKRFTAATQALVTTTVGLALTYTGLVISNPITSQVNGVISKVSVMQSVLQATQVEAFAIATGFNATTNVTHSTPVAPRSKMAGGLANGVLLADVAAVLPTAPFYDTFIANTGTATADSTGAMVVDLEGSIVLPPGGYALWVTPAQASVAGMWFSFDWEEVPVLAS